MDVEEKVKRIVGGCLVPGGPDVRGRANLADDLGADSLDAMEITIALEEEFGIEIADENMAKIKTVEDIITYIHGALRKRSVEA